MTWMHVEVRNKSDELATFSADGIELDPWVREPSMGEMLRVANAHGYSIAFPIGPGLDKEKYPWTATVTVSELEHGVRKHVCTWPCRKWPPQ